MRTIEWTRQFKRDYKRESKTRHGTTLDANLVPIFEALANDQPLDQRNRDHAPAGNWKDCRDCHIKLDLILIYQKTDNRILRLGSHSELGL
jgi:mRNA interferase YafQ